MPRDAIALTIPDTAAFARALRDGLAAESALPGHLAMLGHIARAAGFRNWQHLRATVTPAPVRPPEDPADPDRVARALRVFDPHGRMARWPNKTNLQGLCLWALWSHLPALRDMTEPEVNTILKDWSTFGDHVLLRRSLIDHRLATRTPDGRSYRRAERRPPADARALLAGLKARAAPPELR
jgi:hypothetical protein